jgi:hypothetical protein
MMQMLSAGGMAALTDRQRSADANNPRGYFELEPVKSLARNPEVIDEGEGKVIKVVSSLLRFLPNRHQYRVIFMLRPLEEVVASQDRMLERLGQKVPPTPKAAVLSAFEKHLEQIRSWLSEQPNVDVLYVDYGAVLEDAHREASRICDFLEQKLNVDSMACKVEQSLHREKIRA